MTGRWVSPVGHDRTRPVVKCRVWNLTRNDRTLRSSTDQYDRSVRSARVQCSEEPNGSISWGLLFKPHGRLKLTLLAICIDIATL